MTERMLAGRLLQLCLVPLSLLICQQTEEVEEVPSDSPVAAALVSGENSDLGKCYLCYLSSSHHLVISPYCQGNIPGMLVSSERSPRLGSLAGSDTWVRRNTIKRNITMNVETH